MIRSHFARGVSEQDDMQRGSFQGWCKEASLSKLLSMYGNDPKFSTDWSGLIVQTQIRLLLEEQSDQGHHYLLYCLHFLDALHVGKTSFSSFRIITAKLSSVRKFWNFTVDSFSNSAVC